jgi:hypothetical protein
VTNDREAWRPALIAYWRRECCFQRADNLSRGEPFDYLDIQAIEAIEAALAALKEVA